MSDTPAHDWCEILHHAIRPGPAIEFVTDPTAGGIALFLGTTRAETHPADNKQLLALDYEAYDALAAKQLRDLASRARAQWPMILRLAILHCTGRVAPGEPSVCIAVSTPHRAEAFEACRWLIDTLKSEVAVWKKEIWDDGSGMWVDPESGT